MTNQLQQVQLLETKLANHYEHRHLTQAADGVFMAAFREGEFVRFTSVEQAVQYYSNKLEDVSTELRANQNNPAAIYLHV